MVSNAGFVIQVTAVSSLLVTSNQNRSTSSDGDDPHEPDSSGPGHTDTEIFRSVFLNNGGLVAID